MRPFLKHLFLLLSVIFIYGCSPTRHIKEGEHLLRKQRLHLESDKTIAEKGRISDELSSLFLQEPNTYLFGFIPYKVWLYNLRYKKYQNDSTNFQITSKVVEKPVIIDTSLIPPTEERMKSSLKNDGYFYAEVSHEVKYRKKKAVIDYYVNTGHDYVIDTVFYDIQSKELEHLPSLLDKESLLAKGRSYSNTLAGEERARLTTLIRNLGYYKFSAENISFELDTLDKPMHLDKDNLFQTVWKIASLQGIRMTPSLAVKVLIHPTENELAFRRFHYKNIVVFPDYKDTSDLRDSSLLVKTLNKIQFRFHKSYVNTPILEKKIFIRPGKEYSETDYNRTIGALNDLGIFKYVRVFVFETPRDTLKNSLSAYILMNPTEKFDFNTNLSVSGGDLYTIGSSANVSVTDKNFLKGANQLTTTLSFGVEMRQNKSDEIPFFKQFYLSSQNLGLNFRLSFPKFLLPVSQSKFSRNNVPRTMIEAGVTSLKRLNYFSLLSYNSSFGYLWRETDIKSWTVRPIFVNILNLSNIDPDFQLRMDSVPAIKNSYQETFIQGENVEYVINTEGKRRKQYAYVKLGLEEAGGVLSGVNAIGKALNSPLSISYAQYVRLDFDLRQYFLQRNSSVIFRMYGGVGIPYGGSTVLPYIKQYYTGGAYSLRGWRPRIMGPGSYYDEKNSNTRDNLFIDQAGDIKLELNGEFRFNMIKLFSGGIHINGAVFTDAGNIWLSKPDPHMEGAHFELRNLYQDIAMSSGAGLRADLGGFLVLRFDWAFPVKKPYIFENSGWVINDINFNDRNWRKENVNFNVAIGYPF